MRMLATKIATWSAFALSLSALSVACMPLSDLTFDTSHPEMVAFGSCNELSTFLKTQALTKARFKQNAFDMGTTFDVNGFASERPTIDGTPSPIPQVANVPFSETNLQEVGVDEADIFKVDGTHAFALHGNTLVIIEALGDVDPTTGGILKVTGGRVVAEVPVSGKPYDMFLYGNRVVVMTRTSFQEVKLLVGASAELPKRPSGKDLLKAIVFDVTDRSKPVVEREVAVEGSYLSSRRIENQLYIVSHAGLGGPDVSQASSVLGDAGWLMNVNQLIQGAALDQWMPYTFDIRYGAGAVSSTSVEPADCTSTYASRATNGDEALGVYSFDLSDPQSKLKSTTIMGDGAIVYASKESIVVALTNYAQLKYESDGGSNNNDVNLFGGWDPFGTGGTIFNDDIDTTDTTTEPADVSGREVTYLHRFALGADGGVAYHATGQVDGWILNQFSLSEFGGYLRVATQRDRETFDAESMIFVLKASSKSGILQAPLGDQSEFLQIVGETRNIAVGEDLYAARFQGDRAYLVTFQEMDPLWTIDLSKPTEPRVRGDLWIPGYSTYLHPIDKDQLLAVGRAGLSDGIKLSLFDVSDMDFPRAVDEIERGTSSSTCEALEEHRAFRYLDDERLLFVPMEHATERGLYVFSVDSSFGFSDVAHIDHTFLADNKEAATVRRAYRIGNYLYSYSGAGVLINDLTTMEMAAGIDLIDVR